MGLLALPSWRVRDALVVAAGAAWLHNVVTETIVTAESEIGTVFRRIGREKEWRVALYAYGRRMGDVNSAKSLTSTGE